MSSNNSLKVDALTRHTRELQGSSHAGFETVCSKLATVESLEWQRNESQLLSIARVEHLLQRQLEVGPLRPRSVSGRLGRDDGHRTDESKLI